MGDNYRVNHERVQAWQPDEATPFGTEWASINSDLYHQGRLADADVLKYFKEKLARDILGTLTGMPMLDCKNIEVGIRNPLGKLFMECGAQRKLIGPIHKEFFARYSEYGLSKPQLSLMLRYIEDNIQPIFEKILEHPVINELALVFQKIKLRSEELNYVYTPESPQDFDRCYNFGLQLPFLIADFMQDLLDEAVPKDKKSRSIYGRKEYELNETKLSDDMVEFLKDHMDLLKEYKPDINTILQIDDASAAARPSI